MIEQNPKSRHRLIPRRGYFAAPAVPFIAPNLANQIRNDSFDSPQPLIVPFTHQKICYQGARVSEDRSQCENIELTVLRSLDQF